MRKMNESSPARKDRLSHRKGGGRTAIAGKIEAEEDAPPQYSQVSAPLDLNSGTQDTSAAKINSRSAHPPRTNAAKQQDTAAYVLDMTLALRNIANDSGLDFLAYLLDMAAEEADGVVRRESQAVSADTGHGST